MCACIGVLYVFVYKCLCTVHMSAALEMMLQVTMSLHVGAGNSNQVLWKSHLSSPTSFLFRYSFSHLHFLLLLFLYSSCLELK